MNKLLKALISSLTIVAAFASAGGTDDEYIAESKRPNTPVMADSEDEAQLPIIRYTRVAKSSQKVIVAVNGSMREAINEIDSPGSDMGAIFKTYSSSSPNYFLTYEKHEFASKIRICVESITRKYSSPDQPFITDVVARQANDGTVRQGAGIYAPLNNSGGAFIDQVTSYLEKTEYRDLCNRLLGQHALSFEADTYPKDLKIDTIYRYKKKVDRALVMHLHLWIDCLLPDNGPFLYRTVARNQTMVLLTTYARDDFKITLQEVLLKY